MSTLTRILFTPGPTITPPWLQEEMTSNPLHHRVEEYQTATQEIYALLKELLGAPSATPLLFRGGGTEMMQAVISNFLKPGDAILIINTGYFAEQWKKIASQFNVIIHECIHDLGYSYDYSGLMENLQKNPVRLVLLQAADTSTGVRNSHLNIGRIIKQLQPSTLLAVDAVLEASVSPIKMELETIDILIGASQKAFMLPPGLGFAVLGHTAKEALRNTPRAFPEFAYDFREELIAVEKKMVRFTPPTQHIVGLRAVLRRIMKETGEWQWYEAHRLRAGALRTALAPMGFTPFPKYSPTNAVSVLSVPSGKTASEIKTKVEKEGFLIEQGFGKIKETVIRIAHFEGTVPYIDQLLETIKKVLQ